MDNYKNIQGPGIIKGSIYNTSNYIKKIISPLLPKLSFKYIANKINYDIGVPSKKLSAFDGNKKDLIEICEKHKKFPSELEKDLDKETEYILNRVKIA